MFKCQIYKEAGHKNKDSEGPDQLRKDVLARMKFSKREDRKSIETRRESLDFVVDYDHQLSKTRRKFGNQVFTFKSCCCHGKLTSFPEATCWSLMSLAAKRAKLQATILLPLERKKVARGNTVVFGANLRHQNSVAPYSSDNRSTLY